MFRRLLTHKWCREAAPERGSFLTHTLLLERHWPPLRLPVRGVAAHTLFRPERLLAARPGWPRADTRTHTRTPRRARRGLPPSDGRAWASVAGPAEEELGPWRREGGGGARPH